VQTFLPYISFKSTAEVLDSRRLNKQILEGYQVLNVLSSTDPKAAWRNHPAVKMWRGHEHILFEYVMCMVDEADKRGIKTDKNVSNLYALMLREGKNWGTDLPDWYKDNSTMYLVTTTHKANLYRKDPDYYVGFQSSVRNTNNKPCCESCSYYWPTHKVA
jgi:hypothetical protein